MKNRIFTFYCLLCIATTFSLNGQNLLDKLNNEFANVTTYEIATFKTTRIALGHSVETRKKGALEISMYNRYWNLPTATSERFLADKVTTRFGLDYAFSDRFTLGLGYTNFDKISEGFVKYRLFRQKINSKKSISVTLFQGVSHRNTEDANPNLYNPSTSSSSKYAFTTQVLIAKKFNPKFSAQISPTFIHRNSDSFNGDIHNQFAIGFSGRHKISGHTSIVSEYYYVTNPFKAIDTHNAFVIGVNWELSHLMLQFHITNARNYAEDTFITQTGNNFNFKDPNLHFGFNATFVLHTKKKKIK